MGPRCDHRLVLWDVDHTLIETRGVGRAISMEAFESATGVAITEIAAVTGRTEPDIFEATASLNGLTRNTEMWPRYANLLAAGYEARLDELRTRGRALPGAAEVLAALADVDGLVQAVLTGNLRKVAELKLRAFDLHRLVDFDAGAYGSDNNVRARLVDIALQRAGSRYDVTFNAADTVIIGDTPADIETARDAGARVIAVASGKYGVEELSTADAVLADLTDTQAVVNAVIG